MKYLLLQRIVLGIAVVICGSGAAIAQSTVQDFPTPIVSNEISGTIKARDLGDPRVTTYYFALNGDQGDLFINLVTRNFTGDIDVFTVAGQRPMTKIVVYADYAETETGRAIYLRKPERLLLRVQGRTPNDDDATFRLKFAGSFVAARPDDVPSGPEQPRVSSENRTGIRVTSVGTIIPSPSKPDEPAASKKEQAEVSPRKDAVAAAAEPEGSGAEDRSTPPTVVPDPANAETRSEPARSRRNASSRRRPPVKTTRQEDEPAKAVAKTVSEPDTNENEKAAAKPDADRSESGGFRTLSNRKKAGSPKKAEESKPDPLESVNLVVQLKDGRTLEKKMSEVFKFGVDKGILTVVLKDGSVSRYSIVDVAKLTIE